MPFNRRSLLWFSLMLCLFQFKMFYEGKYFMGKTVFQLFDGDLENVSKTFFGVWLA